ncbi:MAG: energy-coupling factor ABC transporter ATP-binding protein [Oscillospiraceae bacterium]|jgi:energy-coupling factor transport system ATP-binding protein|nr:energy-coupling factor ABC transporter ATP-binding protein [Oscillospiraceae bacterium]
MEPIILLEDVSFSYEGASGRALDGVRLSITPGEFVGVIGPAGAGKTTLAHALSGVTPHVRRGDFYGAARVAGLDTVSSSVAELSKTVGCVFQDIESQFVTTMVEDEILFALENFSVPRDEIPSRVDRALNDLDIADLRLRSISTLSGGQKQKVALAAALALAPSVLVLDEATGELDPASSVQVFELLTQLQRERGATIIVIEQKIMLLCAYAERLLVMDQGRVVIDGSVRRALEQPDRLLALGVNCPRVTTLAARLREKGLYHGAPPVSLDEAEAMVREALA